MNHKLEKSSVPKISFWRIFVLMVNALTWYYIVTITIDEMLSVSKSSELQLLIVWVMHYFAVFGLGIVGAILSETIAKEKLIRAWTISSAIASGLPILFGKPSIEVTFLIGCILGATFGFGMPSCLAYFGDNTVIEKRGSKGGLVFLVTNFGAFLFVMFFQMTKAELMTITLIATIWRVLGLMTFMQFKCADRKDEFPKDRRVSFSSIFKNRIFMLYFIAWLFFCSIDRFEKPILLSFFGIEVYNSLFLVEPIIGSVSAFVGGIFSDVIGRKRMAIYGFVILGIAYAVLGIMPTSIISWCFHVVMDAIGAGILWVIFILVLWGDIASYNIKEKYYLIGSTPFFITDIIRFLMPIVVPLGERIRLAYAMFSIASFFLFLAVVPLMYAPETLPEKTLKERELRSYIEKAKKIKEKYV